jgi:hypothetical protein
MAQGSRDGLRTPIGASQHPPQKTMPFLERTLPFASKTPQKC